MIQIKSGIQSSQWVHLGWAGIFVAGSSGPIDSIAFDAQSYYWTNWAPAVNTLSHTTSWTDRLLLVTVSINNGWNTVVWVTYAGVAMTELGAVGYQQSTPWNTASLYVYSLINPTIGTNDIVVTVNASSFFVSFIWTSYTGANQTTQPSVIGTQSQSNATSITKSLSVVRDYCWHFWATNNVASSSDETTWTKTGNLQSFRQTSGYKGLAVADSNGAVALGTQSTWFSYSSAILESHIALCINSL